MEAEADIGVELPTSLKDKVSTFSSLVENRLLWFFCAFGLFIVAFYVTGMIIALQYRQEGIKGPELPENTSSLSNWPSPSSTASPSPSSAPSIIPPNFLVLTDIHYDPLYSEYAPASDFCRFEKGELEIEENYYFSQTCVDDVDIVKEEELSYRYGTYGCDSPPSAVYSMLKYIQNLPVKPEFILILGDIVSHCTYSQEHLINVFDEVLGLIKSNIPDIPIFVALGNNDIFPHNRFPIGPSELLSAITSVWRKHNLLPEETLQTFEEAGFYSISPNPKLRIIALNSLYYFHSWCATEESCDEEVQEDPAAQFAWIVQELDACRDENQKAYFIGHVGPQCSSKVKKALWKTEFTYRFQEIIAMYPDVVEGLFFSHVHRDSMNLILRDHSNNIYAPQSPNEMIDLSEIRNSQTLFVTPAVAATTLQNPSFRQVFVEEDYVLKDFQQFYFDLEQVQRGGLLAVPMWQREYIFTEAYDVPDITSPSILDLFIRLQTNTTLLAQWKQNRVTESAMAYEGDYQKISDPTLWCSMASLCNYLGPCMNKTNIQ